MGISIYDYLDLANIKKNYLEYTNGARTYYYHYKTHYDLDWSNKFTLEKDIKKIVHSISELSENYVVTLTITGHNESTIFENLLKKEKQKNIDNNFIINYLDQKKNFLAEYKKLSYIVGISPMNKKIAISDFDFMELEPLKEVEVFNMLDNILNIDRYNDDLKKVPEELKGLQDPTKSISSLLLKSYITEGDRFLNIGDTMVAQMAMSSPPPIKEGYFLISDLINHLSSCNSNFMITLSFKNNKSILSSLLKKRMFSKGALLSFLSSVNGEIAENISRLEEELNKEHLITSEVYLLYSIFNKNEEKLVEDLDKLYKIPGLSGSTLVRNSYSKFSDYLAHIPGYFLKHRYNFVLTSREISALLMLPKIEKNDISIFTKRAKYISSFSWDDESLDAPGGIVFAPPGKGKSALLNYIILNYRIKHVDKLMSLIIDFGGSYYSLMKVLNEEEFTYTTLDINNVDSSKNDKYNVFDLEFGKPITESLIRTKSMILINFFKEALKILDNEENLLYDGLLEMYDQFLFKNRYKKTEIVDGRKLFFIDKYNESNYTDKEAFFRAMPDMSDLVQIIASTTKIKNSYDQEIIKNFISKINVFITSPNGKIFSTISTNNLLNKHLIVDLKEIAENNPPLLNLVLIYLLQSKMLVFSNPEYEDYIKLLFIDEFDQFRKRSDFIGQYVNTVFKTGRKLKIHQFLVSQNVKDFNQDLFNSCAHLIAFHPNTLKEIEDLSSITGDDMSELKILETIHTKKGEYSEFVVFTNNETKDRTMFRFRTSKFEYYSFITTSNEERKIRDEFIDKYNGNVIKAMEKLSEYFD